MVNDLTLAGVASSASSFLCERNDVDEFVWRLLLTSISGRESPFLANQKLGSQLRGFHQIAACEVLACSASY